MSTRRKRPPEPEEHENHERWLVTYADMITLLFVLFVVMFSMSQVDKEKYDALKQGLQEQFGTGPEIVDGGTGIQQDSPQTDPMENNRDPQDSAAVEADVAAAMKALEAVKAMAAAKTAEQKNLEKVRDQILAELKKKNLQDSVRFSIDERGLHVTIVTDDVLFDLGKANLRPAGQQVLAAVAPALLKIPNSVAIEGHTDNLPMRGGQFPSNWELSTARATSVLRYMTDTHRLPPKRVSASGYADQRGLKANTSPANRAINRRVEVVVLAAPSAALPASLSGGGLGSSLPKGPSADLSVPAPPTPH